MSVQLYVPVPGESALVNPARIIPALPPGISILPGKVTAARKAPMRLPVGLIVFLVFAALGGLFWFTIWSANHRQADEAKRRDDDARVIVQAVTPAMLAHAPKGTRLPVNAFEWVAHPPGRVHRRPPSTRKTSDHLRLAERDRPEDGSQRHSPNALHSRTGVPD
jgi:hypothetical protein